MRIYNYLFYKTYLLAQRSKNYNDMPVVGGFTFVSLCLMFNIFTIIGFIEGLGFNTSIEFKKEYKYVFCFVLLGFLLFYYCYKGRYKKIIERYERKKKGVQLHPVMVIIIYYGISVCLMFLAAFYKNHLWIFAK
jgi:hypothetical protein